jgi:diguanylate cyclase (GGDEF)-like protein
MDHLTASNFRRVAPWLYGVAGVALAIGMLLPGVVSDSTWRIAVAVLGGTAPLLGWRLNRMPLLTMPALAVATLRLAVGPSPHTNLMSVSPSTMWAVLDVGVGLVLTATLGVVLVRRRGHLANRDLVDGVAVLIGAAILTWVLVAGPMIDNQGTGIGFALLRSAYLPAAVLLLTFTIDFLSNGLGINRTMRLIVSAAVANLVGASFNLLTLAGTLDQRWASWGLAVYLAGFGLLCAAYVHVDGPATLEYDPVLREREHDSVARLLLIGGTVIIPISLIAAVSSSSRLDTIIRTAGTLLLMTMVVIRLSMAIRQSTFAQSVLLRQLNLDELTGLPTRSKFLGRVSEALEATWRSEFQPTIIQVNLDRFKNINDTLGHLDANAVLVAVAQRLAATADQFDGVAARTGGDDFALLDATTRSTQDAMERVEAVRTAVTQPIHVGDSTVFVTASVGVAMAPRNRTLTAEEMMRRTDIATHRAKTNGRNSVAIFDDSMQAHLAHRMDVEHALHGAIGRREMRLYHQPIVDIVTGRVSGFEALMRWQRADGKLVSPGDFIPIAEETGVICELGAWALLEALTELKGWIEDGVVEPNTTMSVNVSPRQIADPNFADIVQDMLDQSGVSPHLLWLEMTESMMLDEPDLAQSTLRKIRQMGVRLALDDFGTGFSSLSLLQQFPIQRIKIDRAFVSGIAEHSNDRSLVRTIIAMANSMGLDLVAEGVETVYQLQSLRELDCNKAQGYLISHPVPAEAMRSTMVALAELTSLSLFSPLGPNGTGYPLDEPCTETDGTATPMSRGHLAATSRPLGQPIF